MKPFSLNRVTRKHSVTGGKFLRITVALLAVLAITIACKMGQVSLTGSGEIVTLQQDFTNFEALVVSDAFQVDIRQGDEFSVTIRADDNLQDYLQVVQKGDTLYIGLQPDHSYNLRQVTLQAEVVMPGLASLDLSGSSHGRVAGFSSGDPLKVNLSGSSSLDGEIACGNASFDLSGSSDLVLAGSAHDVKLQASGASHADLGEMPAVDVTVNLSGASDATVNPSGTINVDASGASQLYYLGSPTLGTTNLSGASEMQRK
jgi:hypothetical protein